MNTFKHSVTNYKIIAILKEFKKKTFFEIIMRYIDTHTQIIKIMIIKRKKNMGVWAPLVGTKLFVLFIQLCVNKLKLRYNRLKIHEITNFFHM